MDCDHCNGTGLDSDEDLACGHCGGTGKVRNTTTQAASIKALRKTVLRAKGPQDPFQDGDVVRWTARSTTSRYTYAALRAGGRWWITGGANYYGHGPSCTYLGLTKILALPNTTDIRVASAWSAV